eukprot:TRINITY_DN60610_c0_g1_i1.p1 TRINITY_DN60610_c0_g1~~TRINITY_DN60610_c0_g1_i1.p1  ORF type:complete len:572 (+),score=156.15 TRINITY_DN60610_c0_g1_i1:54-1769(+)
MADNVDAEDLGLPPLEPIPTAMDETIAFLTSSFLEKSHQAKLHEMLTYKWDRYQSAQAAVQLLEQHGVALSPQEEEQLAHLGDAELIEALVGKVPDQSNEQFQSFFLQLQLMASTALRVRQGLEESRLDKVNQALDDVEDTDVCSHVMKMAVVQAGADVIALKHQHKAWAHDAEKRLATLVRGQEDAMVAKKKLAAARAHLHHSSVSATAKAKQAISNFLYGNTRALLKSILPSWQSVIRREKMENSVHEHYKERLERMQEKLFACREAQLRNVRSLFQRKAERGVELFKQELFKAWQSEAQASKVARIAEAETSVIHEKLKALKQEQAEKAKKLVASIAESTDSGACASCFRAWAGEVEELKMERAAAAELRRVEEHLKGLKEAHQASMKRVFAQLVESSDSGLLHMVFKSWRQLWQESKQKITMEDLLATVESKLSSFGARNSSAACTVLQQAGLAVEIMLILRCFNAWLMETKLSLVVRQHKISIDGKRSQLQGVHSMFRSFATQLESAAQSMQHSHRHKSSSRKEKLSRSEGTVSLPNIHDGRPGSRSGLMAPGNGPASLDRKKGWC